MTIGQYIKLTDRYTYDRLRNLFRIGIDKPKRKIRLGDTAENLMKHDSYKKIGGKIRQTRWE